ncbi:MAG TPA: asparagine synthase (glutamine-hydrolyzing) [Caldilineaceae bacterium]|nr:asparagine synthase (glutamine-hydrolyzing) [Caldilineaceae bacterium]
MCGICGIYDVQRRLAPIQAMNEVQRHRGPDDEGYIFIQTVTNEWQAAKGVDSAAELSLPAMQMINTDAYDLALASRRLAILDLSPAGHMPMCYGEHEFWVTYNGEIFNYRELREELMARGHTFRSDSDTEVILAAYVEWGIDCLSHFNGMFAFALWDGRKQRLFCARDRFGIKPLYYHWDGELLLFASELKSLLQHPAVPRQPDDQSIFDYLAIGVSDHTNRTFFAGIETLRPGSFLLLDAAEQRLQIHTWWDVEINASIERSNQAEQKRIYEEFAAIIEDAIRIRLRSDVPVGTALSGGLDSSTVVMLANRLLLDEAVIPRALVGAHQKTFTARNREEEIDEHCYSQLIIERTGAEEHLIYPDGEKLWQEFEEFVWYLDEPVNSTSQYAQWNVMRLAKSNNVTVLLDGQGGDEILAGYYSYYAPYLGQIYQQRGVWPAARAVYDVSRIGGAPVIDMLIEDSVHRLPWRVQQVVNKIRPPLAIPGGGGSGMQEWQLQPEFIQRNWERRWQPLSVDESGLVGVLRQDLTSTNLPKLLRYEDRISMAFSLETRLPFLDYRLVDMVFRLPLNYRIHNGWSKWILRRSMSDLLPEEICWRRTKLGFPTPETRWLQQGATYIRRLLREHDSSRTEAYIQPQVLEQLIELPDEALATTPGLWRMINLLKWHEIFLEQKAQPPVQRTPELV